MESVNCTRKIMTMNKITVIMLPMNSKTCQYVKISIRLMEQRNRLQSSILMMI